MITVGCEVGNRKIREKLEHLLSDAGYPLVSPRQRRPSPDYRIISISPNVRLQQLQSRLKLPRGARTQFIVFADGDPDANKLRSIFSGHTLSLHDMNDPEAPKDAVERIRDDQFLKPLLEDLQSARKDPVAVLYRGLLHSGVKGVVVIDRSFREIYRNDLHRKIQPGRPCTGRLCWQKFVYFADRTSPCINCPNHDLFQMKPGQPLPPSRFVIRNVRNKMLCILLEVWPIYDSSRDNRVVASVENGTVVDPARWPAKEILGNTLSVLLDMGFSRARVFSYSDATKSVRGFLEKSRDPEGLTGTTFSTTVLPVGTYNGEIFETMKPVVLDNKKDVPRSPLERVLYDRFKKDDAPVWAEFPLLDGNRILGKVVLDKWSPDHSIPQRISEAEMEAVRPFVRFAAKVLVNSQFSRPLRSLEDASTLTWCTGNLVAKLASANSLDEIKSTLVEGLVAEHFSDRVMSAFIRIRDEETGTWPAPEHGAGQHWRLLASKAISSDDPHCVTSRAFDTGELFGDLVSSEEKAHLQHMLMQQHVRRSERESYTQNLYARCSIPIAFGDHTFGVLAVQGKIGLLDEDSLDNLRILCAVVGSLLHLHGRINEFDVVKKYKSKMLRWFSHDATKAVIALRDLFIEPLKRGTPEDLPRLAGHADQLMDIISAQFLAYGWLGGKDVKWNKEDVSVRAVFEPILNMVVSDAPEVELDISKVPDVQCQIDRLKTMAMVQNLVDNAVKAIRKRHVDRGKSKETGARQPDKWKIEMGISIQKGNVVISITDNGCGLRPEEREHIFQQSSGQGLAVVKGFAELAGGTVTCESTLGTGTTFRVSLPI